ncbi:hypothetical protein SAMD00019534_099700 [Acytostelium subglobosum LB1]|uniref:hypothetical protein n=1 Tax=Acytostelium subglobosum LB1 TaxID=1410327 RepID=UPI000644A621|nr:hypothetical protein SAMD00019534_099700 [Acytostelium subglobosum LB1]GAM26795.1 hypothetical protein SAMD00019534_099700 [Acytostelium subglobosum LB1]|eukprot:XP_012750456.1 hypothetical protein SAMD00019534_099700 [Acytostelium subglobosum LB1]
MMQKEPEKLEPWVLAQKKVFTKWCNIYLALRELTVTELQTDFQDGFKLANLLETLSGKNVLVSKMQKMKSRLHLVTNVNFTLKFITDEGIKLVGLSGENIVDGDLKMIMGLIWTLIKCYQIQTLSLGAGKDGTPSKAGAQGGSKESLLNWTREQLDGYSLKINDFTTSFKDGTVFCALIHRLVPEAIKMEELKQDDPLFNLKMAFDTAHRELNIPSILEPEEVLEHPDEQSIMTYVSLFPRVYQKANDPNAANKRFSVAVPVASPSNGKVQFRDSMSVSTDNLQEKLREEGERVRKEEEAKRAKEDEERRIREAGEAEAADKLRRQQLEQDAAEDEEQRIKVEDLERKIKALEQRLLEQEHERDLEKNNTHKVLGNILNDIEHAPGDVSWQWEDYQRGNNELVDQLREKVAGNKETLVRLQERIESLTRANGESTVKLDEVHHMRDELEANLKDFKEKCQCNTLVIVLKERIGELEKQVGEKESHLAEEITRNKEQLAQVTRLKDNVETDNRDRIEELKNALLAKDKDILAAQSETDGLKNALQAKDKDVLAAQAETDGLKNSLEAKDRDIVAAQAETDGLKNELQAKDKDILAAQAETDGLKNDLQAKDRDMQAAQAEKDGLKQKLEELERGTASQGNDLQTKIQELMSLIEAKDVQIKALDGDKTDLLGQLDKSKQECQELKVGKEGEHQDLSKQLDEQRERVQMMDNQAGQLKEERDRLAAELADAKEQCSKLNKEIEEKNKMNESNSNSSTQERQRLIDELDALKRELAELKGSHSKISEAHDQSNSEKNKLIDELASIRGEVDKFKDVENNLQQSQQSASQLEKEYQERETRAKEERDKLISELNHVKDEMAKLKLVEDALSTLQAQHDKTLADIDRALDDRKSLQDQLDAVKSQLANNAQGDGQTIKKLEEQVSNANNDLEEKAKQIAALDEQRKKAEDESSKTQEQLRLLRESAHQSQSEKQQQNDQEKKDLQKSIEKLQSEVNDLRQQLGNANKDGAKNLEQLQASSKDMAQEKERLEKELAALKQSSHSEIQRLTKESDDKQSAAKEKDAAANKTLTDALDKLKTLTQKYYKLENDLNERTKQQDQLTNTDKQWKSLGQSFDQLQELIKKNKKNQEEKKEAAATQASLQERISALEDQLRQKELTINGLNAAAAAAPVAHDHSDSESTDNNHDEAVIERMIMDVIKNLKNPAQQTVTKLRHNKYFVNNAVVDVYQGGEGALMAKNQELDAPFESLMVKDDRPLLPWLLIGGLMLAVAFFSQGGYGRAFS